MKAWQGVDPCPHSHLYMHGTKECAECWKIRFDAYWHERFPDEDVQPFEAGDEDTQHWTDELEAIKQA
jgi:hypothetical protein